MPDGAVAEHADPHRVAVPLAGQVPDAARCTSALPRRVGVRRGRRPDREQRRRRSRAARSPPGGRGRRRWRCSSASTSSATFSCSGQDSRTSEVAAERGPSPLRRRGPGRTRTSCGGSEPAGPARRPRPRAGPGRDRRAAPGVPRPPVSSSTSVSSAGGGPRTRTRSAAGSSRSRTVTPARRSASTRGRVGPSSWAPVTRLTVVMDRKARPDRPASQAGRRRARRGSGPVREFCHLSSLRVRVRGLRT